MAEYVPYCSDFQVSGMFILSQLDCMGAFRPYAEKILAAEGIVDPVQSGWYNAVPFLKVFSDMAQRFGANTVFTIGRKTAEQAPLPPEINSIETGLACLCMAYSMHHRGRDIGWDRFTKTGERSGIVVCHNPYSCDWDRGAFAMILERFKQPGQFPKIVHDDTKPCRKKGGDSCTYNVSW